MWILLTFLLSSNAGACDSGCTPYQGTCACDQKPEPAPSVKPSDEKPPRSGMPSYQDPSVKATTPSNLTVQDMKWDQERTDADTQGKKAAGIR